ncbi:MAG: preprotein translocase subunit SecY [Bacilli bacterium]
MKKLVAMFKNRDIMNRIVFTIMILLVFRIGAAVTVPGVTLSDDLSNAMNSTSALSLMNLLGGGALQNFSIFALGVSPYITAQIIVQLLSMDVLPALSDLRKQGEYGRKKIEMTTRYLTLMLGAVQAYGIIKMMENSSYVTLTTPDFWTYAYLVIVMMAGSMFVMWLGDQITTKGIGNGISMIIFTGIVVSLPNQIGTAYTKWITYNAGRDPSQLLTGVFQFVLYILAFLAIIAFVIFIESSKRKIPVQSAGRSGGTAKMASASFLPIKVNSAGVIPVIFASSLLSAPSVIASFISGDAASASWLKIFSISESFMMPGPDGSTWPMPRGLLIYLTLVIVFTFFYSQMQINPEQMADNFQKNGSYIPGIRPGNETQRYISKVLNRVTFIGALSLAFIAGLPVVLQLSGIFGADSSLAFGGTGLIIVVGVALELNNQINGLIAGKTYDNA